MSSRPQERKQASPVRPMGRGRGRHGMPIETPKNARGATRRLLGFFAGEWPVMIPAGVGVVVAAVCKAAAPGALGGAIEQHIEISPSMAGFIAAMTTVLALYLGGWAGDVLSGVFMARAGNRLVYRLRRKSFGHVQKLSMAYFDKVGIGDLMSRLTNDIEMIYNALTNGFTSLVGGLFSMVGILIAMLFMNPLLTVLIVAVFPIIIITTALVGRLVRRSFRTNQQAIGKLQTEIEESVSAVKLIKSFGNEKSAYDSFVTVNDEARAAGQVAETASIMLHPIMRVVNGLSLAIVIGVGGYMVVTGVPGYTVGLMTAFVLYGRRVFEPLRGISGVYNLIQSALAGSERIFEVLDQEPDIEAEGGEAQGSGTAAGGEHVAVGAEIRGSISIDNVTFSYLEGSPVLHSVNLDVSAGETIAIVGPTGAGKTTLVNLLSRFYDPDAGKIRIDGKDVRDIPIHTLRRSMGVVLQEPYFFADTIRENIAYGQPRADEETIVRAAKRARADESIRHLPEGYDTKLVERGMNLAQGERQLLAIARAVLAEPRILILDEATSSIDSLTERRIQEGLLELMAGRTSFIIAHRLSTIQNADRVVVVENGRVLETGSHDELMAAGGRYAQLQRSRLGGDFDRNPASGASTT